MVRRYGIFGGAFDPPHTGHLAVAQAACREMRLDTLFFVPTFSPPHRSQPRASFHHRLGMLQAMTENLAWAKVSGVELEISTPTYAIDMVRRLKAMQNPNDRAFFLLGADNYRSFKTWSRWRELLEEAELIVYPRGDSLPMPIQEIPAHFLQAPLIAEQSSAIRQGLERGAGIDGMPCLPAVIAYIKQNGLYGVGERSA